MSDDVLADMPAAPEQVSGETTRHEIAALMASMGQKPKTVPDRSADVDADALDARAGEEEESSADDDGPSTRQEDGSHATDADATPEEDTSAEGEVNGAEAATDAEDGEDTDKPVPSKTWSAVFREKKAARALAQKAKGDMAAARAQAEQAQALLNEFQSDPFTFVEKRGYNFDAWAKRRVALAEGKDVPPEAPAKAPLTEEQLEARVAEKVREASNLARMEAKAEAWLESVPTVLSQDKYALINDWQAGDELAQLAAIELKNTGKWLTPTEAADRIVAEIERRIAATEARKAQRTKAAAPSTTADKPSPQANNGPKPQPTVKRKKRAPDRPMSVQERNAEIQALSHNLRWKS